MRIGTVKFHKKQKNKNLSSSIAIENIYSAMLFFTAVAWGAVLYIFTPIVQESESIILVIFPLSVLVGGVTKMALSKKASLAYTVGVILIFTSFFIFNWSSISLIDSLCKVN